LNSLPDKIQKSSNLLHVAWTDAHPLLSVATALQASDELLVNLRKQAHAIVTRWFSSCDLYFQTRLFPSSSLSPLPRAFISSRIFRFGDHAQIFLIVAVGSGISIHALSNVFFRHICDSVSDSSFWVGSSWRADMTRLDVLEYIGSDNANILYLY
jgi:hypothetical protein